jgi:hypothetical protein
VRNESWLFQESWLFHVNRLNRYTACFWNRKDFLFISLKTFPKTKRFKPFMRFKRFRKQQERIDWLNGEGLVVASDATPLDFLRAVYRDPQQPMSRRVRAASDAAQYAHPQLKAMAVINGGDFAEQLDRARLRSEKVRVIEARPVEEPKPKPTVEDAQK